ncbi:MAG: hypothetical protein GWN93_06040 [Deltaproteobacteria bacterium]|nr:hypothetical protein [Deltaproteobacteria bacterium]
MKSDFKAAVKVVGRMTGEQMTFTAEVNIVSTPAGCDIENATSTIRHMMEALLNHGPHYLIRSTHHVPGYMKDEVIAYLATWPKALPWLDELWDEYGCPYCNECPPLAPVCGVVHDNYMCIRKAGHEGKHVACAPGAHAIRVWEDE